MCVATAAGIECFNDDPNNTSVMLHQYNFEFLLPYPIIGPPSDAGKPQPKLAALWALLPVGLLLLLGLICTALYFRRKRQLSGTDLMLLDESVASRNRTLAKLPRPFRLLMIRLGLLPWHCVEGQTGSEQGPHKDVTAVGSDRRHGTAPAGPDVDIESGGYDAASTARPAESPFQRYAHKGCVMPPGTAGSSSSLRHPTAPQLMIPRQGQSASQQSEEVDVEHPATPLSRSMERRGAASGPAAAALFDRQQGQQLTPAGGSSTGSQFPQSSSVVATLAVAGDVMAAVAGSVDLQRDQQRGDSAGEKVLRWVHIALHTCTIHVWAWTQLLL